MKPIQLDDNLQAQCGVIYGNDEPELERPPVKPGQKTYQEGFRSVTINITVTKDGEEVGQYEGKTYCSPTDKFNRTRGRRNAIRRAFDQDTENGSKLNQSARAKIVRALLPWLFTEPEVQVEEATAAE